MELISSNSLSRPLQNRQLLWAVNFWLVWFLCNLSLTTRMFSSEEGVETTLLTNTCSRFTFIYLFTWLMWNDNKIRHPITILEFNLNTHMHLLIVNNKERWRISKPLQTKGPWTCFLEFLLSANELIIVRFAIKQ